MVQKGLTNLPRIIRWLWAGMMLALPVSSFPLIASTFGVQSVAALSIVFLFILFVIWFIPYLLRGGKLPQAAVPILAFVLVALVASFGSFFLPIPNFRNIPRWGNLIQNLITLGVGVSAYLLVSAWLKEKSDIKFLLRWLNYGGLIIILWSGVQAYFAFIQGGYPAWMEKAQTVISSSSLLYVKRVTGLAFEPSWLAHQLNMIFLPWWLAASLHRSSAHRFRIWVFSLENLLLVGGLLMLALSYSRIGWLAFLVVIAYLILLLSLRLVGWLQGLITQKWEKRHWKLVGKTVLPVWLFIGVIGLYLGMFLGAGYSLSRLDPRMKQLFDIKTLKEEGVMMFANRLVFAERIVFWQTGYDVFNDYPVLGVGIGNSGYYFPEKMPAFGYGLTEVSQLLFEQTSLPNSKSLWTRLASETGLVGLACFFTWLFVNWRTARFLKHDRSRFIQAIGLFGEIVVVAMVIEGFSVDTFALPYFWLSLGILTAAFTIWVNGSDQDTVGA